MYHQLLLKGGMSLCGHVSHTIHRVKGCVAVVLVGCGGPSRHALASCELSDAWLATPIYNRCGKPMCCGSARTQLLQRV